MRPLLDKGIIISLYEIFKFCKKVFETEYTTNGIEKIPPADCKVVWGITQIVW